MAKILIVEDEEQINDLIKKNLCLVGHECIQIYNGSDVVDTVMTAHFDLIILDVMLPGLSGFDVITQIKDTNTPIVFVTAKNALNDKLKGLRLGAEDYIVKPFEILELLERVNVVLRRTKGASNVFEFDDISIDFDSKRVYKNRSEVILTPKEFDLLEALVTNRNLALSRDRLIYLVWTYDFDGDSRTVDTHIQRLRKKLGLENRLKTIFKTGYRLDL